MRKVAEEVLALKDVFAEKITAMKDKLMGELAEKEMELQYKLE